MQRRRGVLQSEGDPQAANPQGPQPRQHAAASSSASGSSSGTRAWLRALFLAAVTAAALLPLLDSPHATTLLQNLGIHNSRSPSAAPAVGEGSNTAAGGGKLLTQQQLAAFDGTGGQPTYISILGSVFDVSSKPEFYGKDSGYSHFVAADGTRAFVSGEFDGPVRDDLDGLTPEEVHTIIGWRKFYFETYPYIGRLIGRYYSSAGDPTAALITAEEQAVEGERLKEEKEREQKKYVGCNAKYTQEEGGSLWCDNGWYPRKLFEGMADGSATWRCVCMEDLGWSDLLQVYPGCDPDSSSCVTAPPAA